jgi:hypothetical protein
MHPTSRQVKAQWRPNGGGFLRRFSLFLVFFRVRGHVDCMEFVTVYTTLNPADAELIRGQLESANLTVNVKNEDVVLGVETSGGVLLQVPEDQADEARALLKYQDPSAP